MVVFYNLYTRVKVFSLVKIPAQYRLPMFLAVHGVGIIKMATFWLHQSQFVVLKADAAKKKTTPQVFAGFRVMESGGQGSRTLNRLPGT